ncbi:MAG TPA: flagellar hook protein FlgE [Geobacteraceae bacterium]|nr:flagellar hook protein FlgE [Geobacteraceae bacterium]
MSITSAMQTGVSGLLANGEAISVIGNNLANVNTTGFKEGRTLFSDMLSSNINRGQIGRGTQIEAVQNIFSQGSLQSTGSSTDLAIQGDAMFVVQDPASSARYYTRDGSFTFDKNNILTNAEGDQVLGFGISNGVSNGVPGTINIGNYETMAPKATTAVNLMANLDSTQAVPTAAWTPAAAGFNPITASNFSTSTSVYDAQGNAKQLTLYFAKTGANAWSVYTYDGTTYTAAGAGFPLTFNANGALATGSPITSNGVSINLTGTTQFASASSISSQSQDGYGAGSLQKVSVDENGYVNVLYTNSQTQKIAQVALAKFASPQGLDKEGNNLYSATTASGQAIVDPSNYASNQVSANSLEQSNVDMSDQLVQMIETQRSYTANSKTITTADQMIQDTLNIIR